MKLFLNVYIFVIYLLRSHLNAFTTFGCSKSYFQFILVYLSLSSILLMRWINYGDLPLISGIISFRIFNYLKYSFIDLYFLPWSKKGNSPLKASLYTTTPNEKRSIFELPSLCSGISGAMYIGVPLTEKLNSTSGSLTTFDKPKSAILKLPLCINIFSGLISRWIIEFSYSTLYP